MIVRCTICLAICATLIPEVSVAQVARSRTQNGQQPQTRRVQQSRSPVELASRRRVQETPVDPKLDALLKQWEIASQKITRLQGKHKRRVYDLVFKVEKLSVGQFYHETPDKGRIDIEPVRVPKDAKSTRTTKNKVPFDLISDMQEKWICDGKRIIEINEQAKEANMMTIPPRGQGENIMNGPLPFLFGMKAEVAKKRYQLRLVSDQVNPKTRRREIQIQAFPRWASDGQNWHEARIILDHPTFLPLHVKLTDNGQTKETVFTFTDLQKNKMKWPVIFGNDPFRPSLRKYKVNTTVSGSSPGKAPIQLKPGEALIPDVSAYQITKAKERLQKAGFVVAAKYVRGGPAPNAKLIHKIRTVVPPPMTPLKKGATVKLVVFEQPKTASK